MTSEKGFDRLIAFSDAVVAIALTLLVLPLVELPGDIPDGANIGDVLWGARNTLIAFAVSFLVIWRLWVEHHRVFQHYRAADHVTIAANFVWLATIVVLPFPTALLSSTVSGHGAEPLYLAVLVVNTVTLQVMALRVRRHPELADGSDPAWLSRGVDWATPASMVLALILALVLPQIGSWVMLVLLAPLLLGLLRHGFRRAAAHGRPAHSKAGVG